MDSFDDESKPIAGPLSAPMFTKITALDEVEMPNAVNSNVLDDEVFVDEHDANPVSADLESRNNTVDIATETSGDVSGVDHLRQKWKINIKDFLENHKNEESCKIENEIENDNSSNPNNQIDIKSKPENQNEETNTKPESCIEHANSSIGIKQSGKKADNLAIANVLFNGQSTDTKATQSQEPEKVSSHFENTTTVPELKLSPRLTSSAKCEVDFSEVVMPTNVHEKAAVLSPEDSWIRVAIPFLPLGVAIVCLLMNVVLPGSGTMLSGMSIFCCATTRIPSKYDQDSSTVFCVNVLVGMAQFFTTTFLLVGWFWGVAWGVKMIILSIQRRHELEEQRAIELKTMAIKAFKTHVIEGI